MHELNKNRCLRGILWNKEEVTFGFPHVVSWTKYSMRHKSAFRAPVAFTVGSEETDVGKYYESQAKQLVEGDTMFMIRSKKEEYPIGGFRG